MFKELCTFCSVLKYDHGISSVVFKTEPFYSSGSFLHSLKTWV